MTIRKVHFASGILITVFVGLHLFHHTWSVLGAEKHIELMATLRFFYRNIFVEAILLGAVLLQIVSGVKLFKAIRKKEMSNFDKLHVWTGLYLAIFLVIHVSTVLVGRFILHLDTNI
jgi:hypothetical protein